MNSLTDMIWIEYRKAMRSRMVLYTCLAALVMPLALALLILISRNPAVSQRMGLVGAKANLVAFASLDWPTYTGFYGQVIGAAGFILSVFVVAWVFGREFADGTVKDFLAVPVGRSLILLGKFILVAIWSALLTAIIFLTGLLMGVLLGLPGASIQAVLNGAGVVVVTALLVILVVIPYAFFASLGRGYLLPIAAAILAMAMANLSFVLERGEYFPWAIPMLYAEGKSPLGPASYWIVLLTGVAGLVGTYYWWKNADQNR